MNRSAALTSIAACALVAGALATPAIANAAVQPLVLGCSTYTAVGKVCVWNTASGTDNVIHAELDNTTSHSDTGHLIIQNCTTGTCTTIKTCTTETVVAGFGATCETNIGAVDILARSAWVSSGGTHYNSPQTPE
jgi:hypothetical protein